MTTFSLPGFEFRAMPAMPDVQGFQAINRDRRALNNALTMLAIRCAATGKECSYRGPSPFHDDVHGDAFIARGYIAPRGTVLP